MQNCIFLSIFVQQKLKEEREAKRAQLDGRHDYILSIMASCLGLEKSDLEDAILEGNQAIYFGVFFAENYFMSRLT